MSGGDLISFALDTAGKAGAGAIIIALIFWVWAGVSLSAPTPVDDGIAVQFPPLSRDEEEAALARMEAAGVELWRPDPERLRDFNAPKAARGI
jgi:hypothetical protein